MALARASRLAHCRGSDLPPLAKNCARALSATPPGCPLPLPTPGQPGRDTPRHRSRGGGRRSGGTSHRPSGNRSAHTPRKAPRAITSAGRRGHAPREDPARRRHPADRRHATAPCPRALRPSLRGTRPSRANPSPRAARRYHREAEASRYASGPPRGHRLPGRLRAREDPTCSSPPVPRRVGRPLPAPRWGVDASGVAVQEALAREVPRPAPVPEQLARPDAERIPPGLDIAHREVARDVAVRRARAPAATHVDLVPAESLDDPQGTLDRDDRLPVGNRNSVV